MRHRNSLLAVVAAAALTLPLLALGASAGTSHNITHSTCEGYGHTHEYSTYTWAQTTLTNGPGGSCWRYIQFNWWDPYFFEFVPNSAKTGYGDQWDTMSIATNAWSEHKMKRDGVGGEAQVFTNSWQ
jgi:hypothetical protein